MSFDFTFPVFLYTHLFLSEHHVAGGTHGISQASHGKYRCFTLSLHSFSVPPLPFTNMALQRGARSQSADRNLRVPLTHAGRLYLSVDEGGIRHSQTVSVMGLAPVGIRLTFRKMRALFTRHCASIRIFDTVAWYNARK